MIIPEDRTKVLGVTSILVATYNTIGPPLNKKVFPVHRPGGLKRADWDFFFMIFEKKKKNLNLIGPF